ncbi:MAG: UDP-2,3-diacylglucosamine diphosphatase LpxI [Holosporales bacterium]|jgi:DUF1009 family protein|nr:UDP-2,3-diacylglucosamine diphosphatase LpxI [Holosporales bacterium]
MDNKSTIAVIAGSGNLPIRIIEKLSELKREFVVLSISGFGPSCYPQFKIGEVGRILDFIRSFNASDVLFCGAVKRPSLLSLKLDAVGLKWLKLLGVRAFLGDDALLKGIKKLLLKEKINIVGPHSILNTLLTPKGLLTTMSPSEGDLNDIARGIFVLNALARADVGQAVIVQEGVVLGIEAAEGTKCLIERCLALKLSSQRGGVLVKISKTNQEQLVDLPTIGPNTIAEVEFSKLSGIALESGKSQIVDYDETITLANKNGVFIIGI